MEPPAIDHPAAYNAGKLDWVSRYVTAPSMEIAQNVFDELRASEPAPFSGWHRWTTDAPTLGPALHERLRRHLFAGGILVILGEPRFSKDELLSSLTADSDTESSLETAPFREKQPAPFAIDDTSKFERQGVLSSIALATSSRRGFVLVFQDAAAFRAFDIGTYIANQKVVLLEFQAD